MASERMTAIGLPEGFAARLKSEWRDAKRIYRAVCYMGDGNWWRWPLTLAIRVPVGLIGWVLMKIGTGLYEGGLMLPGVKERPTHPARRTDPMTATPPTRLHPREVVT